MSDVLAIISKAVFEKAAGKSPALGHRLGLDRYLSNNRALAPLASGGRLFLVTVRPPDEALWLVAVLDNPKEQAGAWVAAPCATPLTDLSALRSRLVFESGKGLVAQPGALGMSLQTPRVLAASDVELLLAAAAGAASPTSPASPANPAPAAPADPAAALRAAILANPDDEAARLALIEHWCAHGEPRGELARLDLALRGPLPIYRRPDLRAKMRSLYAEHARRWWPWPLRAHHQRGGFLWSVQAEAAQLWPFAPALFAAEPVTELELHGADEESIAELAAAPWAARLRALVVRGPIGDEGFAKLVASRHLAQLRALNVSSNELSAEGLAALEKRLPALERLVLTNNPIGDEGAHALAKWRHLEGAHTLYLSACELSADGVAALCASGRTASLRKLTLSGNDLGGAGAKALAAQPAALASLGYLELRGISLDDAGAKALAAARWPKLRHLDVRGNWCSRDALAAQYRAALVG